MYNAYIGENIHEIERPPYLIPVEYSQSIGNCLNKQKIFTRSLFSCRFNEGEIALISSQRSLLFTFFAKKKMFIKSLLNLNVILIRGGVFFLSHRPHAVVLGVFLGGGGNFWTVWYVEASPRFLPYWSVANCQLLSFRECLNEYICMYIQKKNKEEGIKFATSLYELSVRDFNEKEVWSEINLKYFNYRLCKKKNTSYIGYCWISWLGGRISFEWKKINQKQTKKHLSG